MMANPDRHEIQFKLEDKRYLLTFNNEGKRIAEEVIGMGWPAISEVIDREGLGFRLQTGLFFGASRKYHRRDFPNLAAVDTLLDTLEDADEETQTDFIATLIALFLRDSKEEWVKRLNGELPDGEPEPDFGDGTPAEEADAEPGPSDEDDSGPKEKPPAKKPSGGRSGRSKNSS